MFIFLVFFDKVPNLCCLGGWYGSFLEYGVSQYFSTLDKILKDDDVISGLHGIMVHSRDLGLI